MDQEYTSKEKKRLDMIKKNSSEMKGEKDAVKMFVKMNMR